MVEFLAWESSDLDGNVLIDYMLTLNHNYGRIPDDKWRFSMVGKIDDVTLEHVEEALETLKDDNTMVKNPYYKCDFGGKYPIAELKKWIQHCDYEKAMKEAAQKLLKGTGH